MRRLLFKERFITKAKKSILWNKISYSSFYQRVRFPHHYEEVNKEFQFYFNLLGKDNSLIFDVGANTGEKAAIFKKLAKKIVCFEPSPNAICTLKSRFAFSNVTILPIALSNKKSISKLYIVNELETLNSINDKQLIAVIQPVAKGKTVTTINVSTDTLDNITNAFGTPQYIKIDVEGNECEVVSGLTHPVDLVSFENSTPNFLDQAVASMEHLLKIGKGKCLFNIYNGGFFIFPEFAECNVIKSHLKNHNYGAAEIFCKTII